MGGGGQEGRQGSAASNGAGIRGHETWDHADAELRAVAAVGMWPQLDSHSVKPNMRPMAWRTLRLSLARRGAAKAATARRHTTPLHTPTLVCSRRAHTRPRPRLAPHLVCRYCTCICVYAHAHVYMYVHMLCPGRAPHLRSHTPSMAASATSAAAMAATSSAICGRPLSRCAAEVARKAPLPSTSTTPSTSCTGVAWRVEGRGGQREREEGSSRSAVETGTPCRAGLAGAGARRQTAGVARRSRQPAVSGNGKRPCVQAPLGRPHLV
jgi:hypothetical protein